MYKKIFFLSKHIIMINLTEYQLKLITGNRDIKKLPKCVKKKVIKNSQ